MFPGKPAVESPAPPPVEAEPPPAPKSLVKEGARKRTDPATRARAKIYQPDITTRQNKIRAARERKPDLTAQQLADKFHVSLRTIKRDLEDISGAS